MSLDPMPDAATLLRMKAEREGRGTPTISSSLSKSRENISPVPLPVTLVTPPKLTIAAPDPHAGMNQTERRRALELETLRRAGEVVWWAFEAITFKLADDTRYTPDFAVLYPDGSLMCDETKGIWRDDAKVKIKTAASLFPFIRFRAYQLRKKKEGGGWRITEY